MTYYPSTLIDRSFRERIVLVGVIFPDTSAEALDRELDELALLVDTAGADVEASDAVSRWWIIRGGLMRCGRGAGGEDGDGGGEGEGMEEGGGEAGGGGEDEEGR